MKFRNHDPMRPWITPVYKAQCRSWSKAKDLLHVKADAQRCDIAAELRAPSLRFSFRYLPQHRPADCIAFRREVANAIREERRLERIHNRGSASTYARAVQ